MPQDDLDCLRRMPWPPRGFLGKTSSRMEVRMARFARIFPFGLALCCLLSGPVGAQEPAGSPLRADSTAVSSGSDEEQISGMKSGTTALLWSVLGTAVPAVAGSYDVYRAGSSDSNVPVIVLVGALLIGPSLGHFYAARPGRVLLGIGIRALTATAGAAAYFFLNGIDDSAGAHSNPELGQALGAVGIVLGGASLAWDILRAPDSARIHNEQVRQGQTAIGIAPSIGAAGLGLRVEVTF